MEKIVLMVGFGIVCISFFLCMCVGTQFAWGVVAGLIPTGIGWFFSEE